MTLESLYMEGLRSTLSDCNKSVAIYTGDEDDSMVDYSNLPDFFIIRATTKTTKIIDELIFLQYRIEEYFYNTLLLKAGDI
jgi:hypothetical protein